MSARATAARREQRALEVLNDVNLSIEEGEFVAIVGFSGSGKTTLISTIAGLITPDSGEILLKGKPVTGAGPDRGVVFQSYSLMPWLSVYGNVALAVDAVFPQWTAAQRREHGLQVHRDGRACRMPRIASRRSCPAACASESPWRARWR